MLVLSRKIGQSIIIGEDIEITIVEMRGDQVRLGIEAPREIPINRREILERMRQEAASKREVNPDVIPMSADGVDSFPPDSPVSFPAIPHAGAQSVAVLGETLPDTLSSSDEHIQKI